MGCRGSRGSARLPVSKPQYSPDTGCYTTWVGTTNILITGATRAPSNTPHLYGEKATLSRVTLEKPKISRVP